MKYLIRAFRLPAVMTLVLGLAIPQIASAQLEEIVVTAQKREVSLQDVPVSVLAVTGEALNELNVLGGAAFAEWIPGLQVADTVTGTSTTIRGVGTIGANPAFEPSVATFIDGQVLGKDRALTVAFMDIERVEVLRGPQPLYFGDNAIAGALNIITRKPGDEFEGYIRGTAGSDSEYTIEGAFGGPISDTFGFRVAGLYDERGGWFTTAGRGKAIEQENYQVRGTLTWQPTDNLGFLLKGERYDQKRYGEVAEFVSCAPNVPGLGLNHCQADPEATLNDVNYRGGAATEGLGSLNTALAQTRTPLVHFAGMAIPAANANTVPQPEPSGDTRQQDGHRILFDINYDAENWSFQSKTGYLEYDFLLLTDVDGTQLTQFHVPVELPYSQTTQEFRIQSENDGPFSWMAGLYWRDYEFDNFNTGSLAGALGGLGGAFPNDAIHDEEGDTKAAFASIGWQFTDALRLDVGARYSEISKTASTANGTSSYTFAGPTNIIGYNPSYVPALTCATGTRVSVGMGPGAVACVAGEVDENFTDPEVVLTWNASDDVMMYGRYVEGSKAGGFNVGMSISSLDDYVYSPEEAKSYELGLKSTILDGSMNLNVTLFRTEYDNRQVSALAPVFQGAPQFIIQNAASSESTGLEVDGRWAASDKLLINFAAVWLDSEYKDFPGASCNAYKAVRNQDGCATSRTFDASGKKTELARDWEFTIAADYAQPLANDMQWRFNAALAVSDGIGDSGLTVIEEDEWRSSTATRLNLRLGFGPQDGSWEIAGYANNVTDDREFQGVSAGAIGYATNIQASRTQGATYGVQARYNFSAQ